MLYAEVADRGHVPFLDEPEALHCVVAWLAEVRRHLEAVEGAPAWQSARSSGP